MATIKLYDLKIKIIGNSNKDNIIHRIDALQSTIPSGNFSDERTSRRINEMKQFCTAINDNSKKWLAIIKEIQTSFNQLES
jgi:hypothetical protein